MGGVLGAVVVVVLVILLILLIVIILRKRKTGIDLKGIHGNFILDSIYTCIIIIIVTFSIYHVPT